MSLDQRLLAALAVGSPRAARSLAEETDTTEPRARQRLHQLEREGWPITARPGAGYELQADARPLDPAQIESDLADIADRLDRLVFWPTIGSTQAAVAAEPVLDDGRALVGVADRQTAGYGRRGRGWYAPPGGAITLSLARSLPQPPHALGPLGPALGLAIAEVLRARGVAGCGVKWPNDVFIGRAKVGGVLVDATRGARGGARVVAGVGINYDLGAKAGDDGRADLRSALAQPPVRSIWVAEIVRALVMRLGQAARYGPAKALEGWGNLDVYRDRRVRVMASGEAIEGVVVGVDEAGALEIDTPTGRRRFRSADVSLRAS